MPPQFDWLDAAFSMRPKTSSEQQGNTKGASTDRQTETKGVGRRGRVYSTGRRAEGGGKSSRCGVHRQASVKNVNSYTRETIPIWVWSVPMFAVAGLCRRVSRGPRRGCSGEGVSARVLRNQVRVVMLHWECIYVAARLPINRRAATTPRACAKENVVGTRVLARALQAIHETVLLQRLLLVSHRSKTSCERQQPRVRRVLVCPSKHRKKCTTFPFVFVLLSLG